ncbi:hypothetical protein ACFRFL_24530 [Streptomyces sp. NPDC056708]|uniref:hypothetical protein n=1 Tax=unclassified Streptomyces TaxID=2593676 RepID=UPI0036A43C67
MPQEGRFHFWCPGSALADVDAYRRWDRAEVVANAQAVGRYAQWRRPWVVEDPAKPWARRVGSQFRVAVEHLALRERRLLLMDGPSGLESAMPWLGESGQPLSFVGRPRLLAGGRAIGCPPCLI